MLVARIQPILFLDSKSTIFLSTYSVNKFVIIVIEPISKNINNSDLVVHHHYHFLIYFRSLAIYYTWPHQAPTQFWDMTIDYGSTEMITP